MSQADHGTDHGTRRTINQERARVHEIRTQLRAELVSKGRVSDETKIAMSAACLAYYDAMEEYRSEAIIQDKWDTSVVDELERRSAQTVEREVPLQRYGGQTKRVTKPGVVSLSGRQLLEMSKRLDGLRHTLGFADAPKKDRPLRELNWDDFAYAEDE